MANTVRQFVKNSLKEFYSRLKDGYMPDIIDISGGLTEEIKERVINSPTSLIAYGDEQDTDHGDIYIFSPCIDDSPLPTIYISWND